MRNPIYDFISFLGATPGLSKNSCAATNTCELVSGYVFPQANSDQPVQSRESGCKQVGILYSDIVGLEQAPDQLVDSFQNCIHEANNILMRNIVDNGGSLISIDGHAILAEFEDMDRALRCAVKAQLAARQWNSGPSIVRQLFFRIGITSGDSLSGQEQTGNRSKYLSDHLRELASAGCICISESLRDELDDHPAIKLVGNGKQFVKDLSVPVEAFWIEIDTERFVSPGSTGAVKLAATVS
jgi:class 3 adenylate cyclase